MNTGEAIVFIAMSVLLGVIGYKVVGWWAPGIILASYFVGWVANIIQWIKRYAS